MDFTSNRNRILSLLRPFRHRSSTFILRFLPSLARYYFLKIIKQDDFGLQSIHDFQIKLDLRDKGISRTLFLLQEREGEHRYLLQKILRPEQTILDLGANIGYYVLIENKILGQTGKIIAIEPHPDNFKLLTDNVKLNNLENTKLVHGAVGEQDGTAKLYISKLSNVHSLLQKTLSNSAHQSISVPSFSIESIEKDFGPIDVIRMDIEGYEYEIFNSIIKLNRQRTFLPIILFELHAKKYDTNAFLTTMNNLYQLGYRVSFLANSHIETIKKSGATPVKTIPTDGRLRHIIKEPSPQQLDTLLLTSRCAVLTPIASNIDQ